MTIIQEIFDWVAKQLPDWQSDAFRRIWINRKLEARDQEELLLMLKKEHGLLEAATTAPTPQRLSRSHMALQSHSGPRVVLKSLYDLKSVNALCPKQRLDFAEKGVTVIYGENSSGKSGYSRILKRACRARGEKERILPDVFKATVSPANAEATFLVSIDGKQVFPITWVDGQPPPDCLSQIAVFDSKCARVYVEENNDVVYIPYGLDTFTELARLYMELRERIQSEIDSQPPTPEVIEQFVGEGKLLTELNYNTPKIKIEDLARFLSSDQMQLKAMEEKVADLIANDPQVKARDLSRRKERIDQLRRRITERCRALSSGRIDVLAEHWRDAAAAEKAAQIASKELFAGEPLPGVGGREWKYMFEAARKYSEGVAYPAEPFPVTRNGTRCVLCQQVLDTQAKARFHRFQEFVQRDTERVAAEKKNLLESDLKEILRFRDDMKLADEQLLDELSELHPEAVGTIQEFEQSLIGRLQWVLSSHESGEWDNMPMLSKSPTGLLSKLSKTKDRQIKAALKSARAEELKTAKEKLEMLKLKKLFSESKPLLLAEIDRLERVRRLKLCKKSLSTEALTKKQTLLMEEATTSILRKALTQNLIELGVGHVKVRLDKKGAYGTTSHKVELPVQTDSKVNVEEVLSEGEQRAVAIASFLAELQTAPNCAGIIFDDPVCSLDHLWQERVACRLVAEGKNRQVIIFTHDIMFLVSLEKEARLLQVPLKMQTVARWGQQVGVCDEELPNPAMTLKRRIGQLRKACQRITKIYEDGKKAEYEKDLGHCYGILRKAWERAVEEVLFADVISRFRREVHTKMIRDVEISDTHFVTIYNAMEKCSYFTGHDEPAATGPSLPLPDEIEQDINQLDNFVDSLRQRHKEVSKRRKKLLSAPPAM